MPAIDVTDATFQAEVIDRSHTTPVVVDLWAAWCGPCRTLGPILEKVIDETEGKVVLAKIDTERNPQITNALRVQSIPAVFVAKDGKLYQGFVGALPEASVRQFVKSLLPTEEEERLGELVAKGDEASLRAALDIDPGHAPAVVALAEHLVRSGSDEAIAEAMSLLERIPESAETRRVRAMARVGTGTDDAGDDGIEAKLQALLPKVKGDDDARKQFLDLLELLGPDDPRTATYRKQLTAQLF